MFSVAVALLTATTAAASSSKSKRGRVVADILTAEFAAPGAVLPLCTEPAENDLLPVTFNFPVDGEPLPEQFEVTIATRDGVSVGAVQPNCATLAPANEADELQTVLLLGQFFDMAEDGLEDDTGPVSVKVIGDLSLNTGREIISVQGSSFTGPDGDFLFFTGGPRIVSAELLNSPSDSDNEVDCSVLFPETTAVVRLLFGTGVRQIGPDGEVVPLGSLDDVDPAAALERARGMFDVSFFGRGRDEAELLGLGDVDTDNVIDLCLKMPKGFIVPFRVDMSCAEADDPSADFVVRDPPGEACAPQSFRVSFARFDFTELVK